MSMDSQLTADTANHIAASCGTHGDDRECNALKDHWN
uniref:Uncharacterized protein n=1 Tax=Arundo donax TaxID=35708 RepID=A0A0A9GD57_ARUDO